MVSVLAKETNNFAESTKLNTYAGGRKKQNKQKKKKRKKEKKRVQNLPEKCTMDCFGPFRKDAVRQVIFVTEKCNYKILLHK